MVLGTVLFYATLIILLNLLVDFSSGLVGSESKGVELKAEKGSSLTKDAWARLRSNRMAVFSLCTLIFILTFSFIGPELCSFEYDEQNLENQFLPPGENIGLEPIT